MKALICLFMILTCVVSYADEESKKEATEPAKPESIEKEDFFDKLKWGNFKLGGALRLNLIKRENWGNTPKVADVDFDTFRLQLNYDDGTWFGEAQYRWYYYEDYGRFVHFLHHGWMGYRFDEHQNVKIGVHMVPFGILPWASNNFYFSPAFYVGLEDDYDLGIKYEYDKDNWNIQLAYYIEDEGDWFGNSEDSARYSTDVVHTDGGSTNREEHQFNIRVTHTFQHQENYSTELGLSYQVGLIPNTATGHHGNHYAAAAHILGKYDKWTLKAEAIRYEYSLENPVGVSNDTVRMGGFDFSYNVASRANIYQTGLSYRQPVDWGIIDAITPYVDYGIIDKDEDGWDSTQFVAPGFAVEAGRFYIYFDLYLAQNHPYLGDGNFTNGLAEGGTNPDRWSRTFLINVGYYF